MRFRVACLPLMLLGSGCTPGTQPIQNPPTPAEITANQFVSTANALHKPSPPGSLAVPPTGKASMTGAMVLYGLFHPAEQVYEKRPTAIVGRSTIEVDFDTMKIAGNATDFAEVTYQTHHRDDPSPYEVIAVNSSLDGQLTLNGAPASYNLPGSVEIWMMEANGALTGNITQAGVSQPGTLTVNLSDQSLHLTRGQNSLATNGEVSGLKGYGHGISTDDLVFTPVTGDGSQYHQCPNALFRSEILTQFFYQQVE